MTVHELKCWPPHCAQIARGEKAFEVRRDDRGFQAGDMLHLREWDPAAERYTGRHVATHVTHVVRAGEFPALLQPGCVVMSLDLYRTWVEDEPGPGDWSVDAVEPALATDAGDGGDV